MRLVHLCQEAEVLSRVLGAGEEATVLRKRSGKAYDPELVEALEPRLASYTERLDAVEPWDEALAIEPTPRQISEQLVISRRTTEHHVEHIYSKIEVSTRGAAALFAIPHDLAGGG